MNTKSQDMGSIELSDASKLNPSRGGMCAVVSVILALWFALVLVLGAQGAFRGGADSPPLPIFFGFGIPLVAFFAAYFGWSTFRAYVLGADLRLVTALQAWRWAGLGFLADFAHGILPWQFALPAGLGDMAIGVTAPWIVLRLIRQPSYAASRRYVVWNALGILDLIVAVTMGAICSGFFFHNFTGSVTTAPMAQLPLVLIPAYFVPIFIMLHFTALAQSRQLARSGQTEAAKNF
jgi:hypothetical protein